MPKTSGQVRAAVSALKYHRGLPKLPVDFPIPSTRNADMLDFLQYVFGFQVSMTVVSVCPMLITSSLYDILVESCPTGNIRRFSSN